MRARRQKNGTTMQSFAITDPNDRRYPLTRKTFEDRRVLYHGSWSTWSPMIDRDGLVHLSLPFKWQHVATVFNANQAVGRGSYLRLFLGEGYPRQPPPRNLYLSANFWVARAYATDNGGEVVRKTIQEAEQFERICASSEMRTALKDHWEKGLLECGEDRRTRAAAELLGNEEALRQICIDVKAAKRALIDLTTGGHPVVYAIRVQPEWLGDYWTRHISAWEDGEREDNLRCSADIPTDRIVAKITYPNGTDADFLGAGCSMWKDVVALSQP